MNIYEYIYIYIYIYILYIYIYVYIYMLSHIIYHIHQLTIIFALTIKHQRQRHLEKNKCICYI